MQFNFPTPDGKLPKPSDTPRKKPMTEEEKEAVRRKFDEGFIGGTQEQRDEQEKIVAGLEGVYRGDLLLHEPIFNEMMNNIGYLNESHSVPDDKIYAFFQQLRHSESKIKTALELISLSEGDKERMARSVKQLTEAYKSHYNEKTNIFLNYIHNQIGVDSARSKDWGELEGIMKKILKDSLDKIATGTEEKIMSILDSQNRL
jgi:hypothetical protein